MVLVALSVALEAISLSLVSVESADEKGSIFCEFARPVNNIVVKLALKGMASGHVMEFSRPVCPPQEPLTFVESPIRESLFSFTVSKASEPLALISRIVTLICMALHFQ